MLLLFELTRDYRIVLPLMAAVGLSVWVVERIRPKNEVVPEPATAEVSTEPAASDPRQQFLNRLTVAELMQTQVITFSAATSIVEAGLKLTSLKVHSAIILSHSDQVGEDQNESEVIFGILTLQDINRAIARWESNPQDDREPFARQAVGTICTQKVLYAAPDEFVSDALSRMATRGLHHLPVCEASQPNKILGLLDRDRVLNSVSITQTKEALKPYLEMSCCQDDPLTDRTIDTTDTTTTCRVPSISP